MATTGIAAAIFKPASPGQPVSSLLLVENSANMMANWVDLRDSYMPNILASMKAANPGAPIRIFWRASSQTSQERDSAPSLSTRGIDELRELEFDTRFDNKITPRLILEGIDSLASFSPNHTTSRHLIIFAASSPSDDITGVDFPFNSGAVTSPWQLLGRRMAQHNIRCHLILTPTVDNALEFEEMFIEHMIMQNLEQVFPWFGLEFQIHKSYFSAARRDDFQPNTWHTNALSQPSLSLLPRSSSYPSDLKSLATTSNLPLESAVTNPVPTLVNAIQQTWGLTKKKIYAAQPVREPFCRDERVNESQHQPGPALPLIPSAPVSSPTRDPRQTKSKALRRGERPGPLDLSSRRSAPYPRRSSLIAPLSSPSDISFPSSPSSNISTPMAQNFLESETIPGYLQTPNSPSSGVFYPSRVTVVSPSETIPTSEAPLRQGIYDQNAQSLSHIPQSSAPLMSNEPNGCLPQPPKYTLPQMPQLSSRLLAAASMDGNVPFIFSEEKEKEAKAMLKAAGLQQIPLPQIIAASLSARGRHSMPPSIVYPPGEPCATIPPAGPTSPMTWSAYALSAPSSTGTGMHASTMVNPRQPTAQSHKAVETGRYVAHQAQPGSSSLTGWNG